MSPGDRHLLSSLLWITFQFLFAAIIDPNHQAMALLTPYVSEFKYAPESHPSRNPNCPRRWTRGAYEERRSPDEGPPVGQEPSIEIRAVLIRCQKLHEEMAEIPVTGTAYNISAGRSRDILEFRGFDRDEPAHHSEVKDCRRKLVVTMKFNNVGKTRTREEFVVVDHVLDPVTMRKARLLNPFVFKVRQEQVLQLYGLKFQSVVNGEAKEEVINKKWSNYTGCDDSLNDPTCGQMMFDGKPIPYSQGFCCSCDPDVNAARQPTARSNTPQLDASQKLIPNPEENRIPGYDGAGWNGMFAQLFASPKTAVEKFRNEEGVMEEADSGNRRNAEGPRTLFKRERSLKSSARRTSFGEEVSLGVPSGTVNSPSKGKIEPYIDAVRKEASREKYSQRNIDGQILKGFERTDDDNLKSRKSDPSIGEPGVLSSKRKTTGLNEELVKLENEYEALQKSRKRVAGRAVEPVFRNHSKCTDFRQLARYRARHFDLSNTSSSKNSNSFIETESHPSEIKTVGSGAERREVSSKSRENVTAAATLMSVSSTSSEELFGTITPRNFMSNSSFSPRLSLTTISSNNTGPISGPESTSYRALILRQELVNDELYSPLISNDRLPAFSKDLRDARISESSSDFSADIREKKNDSLPVSTKPKNSPTRDQYADWVIKYAKIHSDRYNIDAPFEEFPKTYVGSELKEDRLTERSPDTLSEIAEKALKEVEFRAKGDASPGHKEGKERLPLQPEPVGVGGPLVGRFDNPYITYESLKKQRKSVARISEESAQQKSEEKFSEGETVEPMKKFIKANHGEKIRRYVGETGYKDSEPASIMRGIGDMVKGDDRYRDKSATVIANHRNDEPASSTEHEYVFLDANGREEGRGERSKSMVNQRPEDLANLKEYLKSEALNDPRLRLMGRKIEMALLGERLGEDATMHEKFKRLDSLVRNGWRSKRSSFRSVAYDDPFERSGDEKQAKIDEEIEKGFAEITEALKESSEGDRRAGKLSSLRESSDCKKKDSMLRDLAMMLNTIPKVETLKAGPAIISKGKTVLEEAPVTDIEKLGHPRAEGNDGHQIGGKRFKSNSRKLVSPGSSQRGSRRTSGEIRGQEIGDMAMCGPGRDDRLSSPDKTGGNYKAIKALTVRSSANKYHRAGDLVGLQESQTNINDIVKQIIKNDYRTSPSWVGKQGFSKVRNKSEPRNRKPSESNRERLARLSTHADRYDIEKKENPSGTFASVSTGVVGTVVGTTSVKGNFSAETTPRITGVKNDKGNTGSELLGTEVMIISEAMTTGSPRSVKSSSSSGGAVNVGEKFSVLVSAKPDVSIRRKDTASSDDIASRELKRDSRRKNLAASPRRAEDKRNDEATWGVKILQLNKGFSRAYNGRNEITGRTIVRRNDTANGGDNLMTTVSRESTKSRENDGGNGGVTSVIEETSNNREATTTGDKETITGYKTKSESGSSVVEDVTDSRNSPTTIWREITSGENGDTVEPESLGVETTSESQQLETSDPGKTPAVATDGFQNSQMSKSFGDTARNRETPRGSFPSTKAGQSSIVLTKTNSVSQEPREYFDSYEFPVGVRKVLLKKLNSNATRNLDADILTRGKSFPHIQRNINRRLINGRECEDDPETYYSSVRARKAGKVDIEDNVRADINRRVAIPYAGDKRAAADPDRMINELIGEKEDTARTAAHKFIRNYHPEETRSLATAETLPPEEEATHFVSNGDVNATNHERDYAMKRTVFAQKIGTQTRRWNRKENLGRGVEFFYDYEEESNSSENPAVKRSFDPSESGSKGVNEEQIGSDVNNSRDKRSSEKDTELKKLMKRYRNGEVKTRHGSRVAKREAGECDERGRPVIVNPEALSGEQRVGENNISESVEEANGEFETSVEPRFDDVPPVKWQGKMDQLKLKKHEEILKEYLNWNPRVDATLMKISSPFSTSKFSTTTERTLSNSSAGNVLPMKDEAKSKSGERETTLKKSGKMHTRNVTGSALGGAERIQEKLINFPENISGSETTKKRKNLRLNEIPRRETANAKNGRRPFGTGNLESREKEEGFGKYWRNIKFGRKEAKSGNWNRRSGRRLMSAYQMDVDADNAKRKEEEKEEGKSTVRKDDQTLPEDEELPIRGDASSFDYLDSSYKKLKRDKLKSNWDQLVDRVIVNNNSNSNNNNNNKDGGTKRSAKKRRSNKQLEEIPSGNGRTAMEKLHFFDAEKYIKMMANKMNRLSNVDNTEQDPGASKPGKMIRDSRVRVGEKFDENQSDFAEGGKIEGIGDEKSWNENEDDGEKLGDYHQLEENAVGDEKMMKTGGDYAEGIPYERESRLVDSSGVVQDSIFGKLGSDFEISISGKVHINGGAEGEPISLSIEGVSVENATSSGGGSSPAPSSRGGAAHQDVATANSNPKKAGATGSPAQQNSTEIQPKRDFIVADKTYGESADVPEVIRATHAEKTSPEMYQPEGSKPPVSPRKTFYDVRVRAHPGYENSPGHGARGSADPGESERKDVDSDFDKSSENLTDDEPLFDYAKLELRPAKPLTGGTHSPRRHYHRFRQERAMNRGGSGEAEKKLQRFGESVIEAIPEETEREATAVEEALNKLRKQSKAAGISSGREDGLEESVDEENPTGVKKSVDKEKDEIDGVVPREKNVNKAGEEPCFAAEPEIRTIKIGQKFSGVKNAPNSGPRGATAGDEEKVRLSTDDLHPSSRKAGDKTAGGETLLKGVEVSSPGESDPHLRERERDVEARKEIELKNLMRMIKFAKKMEELVPRYEAEAKPLDDRPEAVVKIQSILLLPENVSGTEIEGSREVGRSKPGAERVVEIGEGVRHAGVRWNDGRAKERIPDFIILEKTRGVESPFEKDVDGVVDEKEESSVTQGENMMSQKREDDAEVEGNSKVIRSEQKDNFKNGSDIGKLLENVEKKLTNRLNDLENGERHAGENSSPELSPHLHSGKINEESGPSNEGNDRSSEVSRSVGNSLEASASRGSLRRGGNDAEKVGAYSNGVSNAEKPEELGEGNESGETVVGSKLNDVDRRDSYDVGIAEDPEGKEGLAVGYTPRRNSQPGREARTAVARVAFGVREDPTLVESSGAQKVPKEKRRTQHLTNRKTAAGVTRRRGKSKRSHEKKKKRKKKKKKKKHGKKNKVKMETDSEPKEETSRKKWWPFKRNLLAIIEDQEPIRKSTKSACSKKKKKKKKSTTNRGYSSRRKKRQIKAGGTQARGGQDCMDRRHPPHVDSAKYQESAHCLRFSDLWYSVYQLENPIMEHTVYLQLFEKHTLADGSTHWDDLTQGSMIRLGTFVRHQRDSLPTIAFTYNGEKVVPEKQGHALDSSKDRLLVPSPVAAAKLGKYPEVKGGSSEYLVVQSSSINKDGDECDKAGVGFSTFATQPNRCGQPKGTCLKNQPLTYWRHDLEAREAGRPGCYFLSNFASVPNNPIKYNVSGSGSREYLGLEYHSPHVSAIDVEVRADYNAIVRVGSSGRVTEVHVDSTAPEHTVVTIVISNMGLASSPYQSRISDCPTGLPVSWRRAKGAMQVIPPQHDLRVTLDLYGQLFVNGFHCSVEVVNHRGELVAMRRIRVQRMDRCFCVWHCLCGCIGSVAGLRCQAMSAEHYHAAGFQGPVPVASMESSIVANAIKDVMTFSTLVILLLLALGILKWLIGVFLPPVGRRGLDVLLDGTRFDGYFESELRCRCIVTDIEGNIVHPDTGEKSVRICSRKAEFFLNLIFFLTYPIAVCCKCARSSFLARRGSCCRDDSKICLPREDTRLTVHRPQLICVNTYGDSRNSKMEAEDTRYVINELKRSRDSLRYGIKRPKKRDFDIHRDAEENFSSLRESL